MNYADRRRKWNRPYENNEFVIDGIFHSRKFRWFQVRFEPATPHVGTVVKYFPVTSALWNAVRVFGRRSTIFWQMPSCIRAANEPRYKLASEKERARGIERVIYLQLNGGESHRVYRSESINGCVRVICNTCACVLISIHTHIRGNFHRGACGCDGCMEGFTNSRGWAFATAIIGSTLMHAT